MKGAALGNSGHYCQEILRGSWELPAPSSRLSVATPAQWRQVKPADWLPEACVHYLKAP